MYIKTATAGIIAIMFTSISFAETRDVEIYDYLGLKIKQEISTTATANEETTLAANENNDDYTGLSVTKSMDPSRILDTEYSYVY